MKKILILIGILFSINSFSQSTVLLRGDTIKVYKQGGDAVLKVEGHLMLKDFRQGNSNDSVLTWDPVTKKVRMVDKATVGGISDTNFVRNQSTEQSSSNFNINGTGIIRTNLKVGIQSTSTISANADIVNAAGYDAIPTSAADIGNTLTDLRVLNNAQRSRIRETGNITTIKMYFASKPAAVDSFFFYVWRKDGSTWDRIARVSIWSLVTGGTTNTITLPSPVAVLEGDYIGYGYNASSNPGSFLTSFSSTANAMYYSTGEPTETNFDWASQAALSAYVPIWAYMQAPVIVSVGNSIIMGANEHYSYITTTIQNNQTVTIPYQVEAGMNWTGQNMGIAGNTTTQVDTRMSADVFRLHPRVAIYECGVNDLDALTVQSTFIANVEKFLDSCQANSVIAIVTHIFPWTNGSNAKMHTRDLWNISVDSLVALHIDAYSFNMDVKLGKFRAGGDGGNLWDIKTSPDYDDDGVHYTAAGMAAAADTLIDFLTGLVNTLNPHPFIVDSTGRITRYQDEAILNDDILIGEGGNMVKRNLATSTTPLTVGAKTTFMDSLYFKTVPYNSGAGIVHLGIDTVAASPTYGKLVRKTAGGSSSRFGVSGEDDVAAQNRSFTKNGYSLDFIATGIIGGYGWFNDWHQDDSTNQIISHRHGQTNYFSQTNLTTGAGRTYIGTHGFDGFDSTISSTEYNGSTVTLAGGYQVSPEYVYINSLGLQVNKLAGVDNRLVFSNSSGLLGNIKLDGAIITNDTLHITGGEIAHNRATAQTAANTNILTYNTGASDGTFQISANVLVTTATAHSFTVTVDYTDEGSTSRTVTLTFSQLAGTFITAITNVTGAAPYEGVPLTIRTKAESSIIFKTAGTFTTVTYNVDANIVKLN